MKNFLIAFILINLASCKPAGKEGDAAQQTGSGSASAQTLPVEVCYKYVSNATAENPVLAQELLNLRIDGNTVTGLAFGRQLDTQRQSSWSGTLSGKKSGNILEITADYMIDGSRVVEEQEYRIEDKRIVKKEGPRRLKRGKMVLMRGAQFSKVYDETPCQ